MFSISGTRFGDEGTGSWWGEEEALDVAFGCRVRVLGSFVASPKP